MTPDECFYCGDGAYQPEYDGHCEWNLEPGEEDYVPGCRDTDSYGNDIDCTVCGDAVLQENYDCDYEHLCLPEAGCDPNVDGMCIKVCYSGPNEGKSCSADTDCGSSRVCYGGDNTGGLCTSDSECGVLETCDYRAPEGNNNPAGDDCRDIQFGEDACTYCGDGICQLDEVCEPNGNINCTTGNPLPEGIRCEPTCELPLPYCGDDVWQDSTDKACEYTAVPVEYRNNGDYTGTVCEANGQTCRSSGDKCTCCGDSQENGEEFCDLGGDNGVDSDEDGFIGPGECRIDCTYCGDKILQPEYEEECDLGGDNGVDSNEDGVIGSDECRIDCTYCGDKILQPEYGEECDLGGDNGVDSDEDGVIGSDECRIDCTYCGDSIWQEQYEFCDPKITDSNNDGYFQGCRDDCTACGDKILQPEYGEECEYGLTEDDCITNSDCDPNDESTWDSIGYHPDCQPDCKINFAKILCVGLVVSSEDCVEGEDSSDFDEVECTVTLPCNDQNLGNDVSSDCIENDDTCSNCDFTQNCFECDENPCGGCYKCAKLAGIKDIVENVDITRIATAVAEDSNDADTYDMNGDNIITDADRAYCEAFVGKKCECSNSDDCLQEGEDCTFDESLIGVGSCFSYDFE
ncbi:hypothetical protein GF327_05085 [Candidatus Woesearchaeota archaeon]|nr:hypothetical protein [Candidatus Woesearchaeota archaeon]